MSVKIKTPHEIELMREAGRILALVHENLAKEIKPGMSTLEIDRLGEEMIRSFGCIPSFKNYCGYPASICVSVNEEVVHGIPNAKRILVSPCLFIRFYGGMIICRSDLKGGVSHPKASEKGQRNSCEDW